MISDSVSHAALILEENGIIAHYTDTIIGFASLPKEALLQRLIRIKNRPDHKGFILLVSRSEQIAKFSSECAEELEKLDMPQPKPTTWLIKSNNLCPPSLLGTEKKIAVRISHNTDVQVLCDQVGPMVSTSVNLSDQPICTDLKQVRNLFGPAVDYLHLTKNTGSGRPSRVIDLEGGKVIRN